MTLQNVAVGSLTMGMKSINLVVIVLHVGEYQTLKSGQKLKTCRVADQTGSVDLSLWSPWCDAVQESDIIQLKDSYTGIYQNFLTLYIGRGAVHKLGEFNMLFSEHPNISAQAVPEQQQGPPRGGMRGEGRGGGHPLRNINNEEQHSRDNVRDNNGYRHTRPQGMGMRRGSPRPHQQFQRPPPPSNR